MNGAGVNLDLFYACEYPEETSPLRFLFVGRIMKEDEFAIFVLQLLPAYDIS